MKKARLSACFLLLATSAFAQFSKNSLLYDFVVEKRQQLKQLDNVSLFTKSVIQPSSKINTTLSEKTLLSLNRQGSKEMYRSRPSNISLQIPTSTGKEYRLELIQQDINSGGEFTLGTLEGNAVAKKIDTAQGLHYRGYINGDPSSIACISVFANGELMGLFSNADGNFNLGKTDGSDEYILYSNNDMKALLGFSCGTSEVPVPNEGSTKLTEEPPTNSLPSVLCKKVRIYWEADYKLYSNNFASDLGNTANYLTGVFNQVATMYQNEGIIIELTDTYIWVTPNSYNMTTSSNGLASFKSRWNALGNNFKADLAIVIDGAPTNNGGVAYLLTNNLCNRAYAYGYADVYGSYNSVPTYSWDVEVITHEMGHMVGSNHTHWCGWNTGAGGTCGAIDDCYTTEAGGVGSCSSCAATTSTNPTAPVGFKGTVMSYCHLRSGIGINLANGFGPLPQAVIRNTVNNASCALYENKWTGAVNTAWENPGNWGCGIIPNATTDVTIPTGLVNYPVVNSAAVCRRIKQQPSTTVLVKTGFSLTLVGPPN